VATQARSSNILHGVVSAPALCLVYSAPLALLYWALATAWPPLAVALALGVAVVPWAPPAWRTRHRRLVAASRGSYRLWTVIVVAAALGVLCLVDRATLAAAVAAAAFAGFFFAGPVGPAAAWVALAFAISFAVARQPWLTRDGLRFAIGALAFIDLTALFVVGGERRLRRFEWVAFVLLAPALLSAFAFFRGPAPTPPADPRVRFFLTGGAITNVPDIGLGDVPAIPLPSSARLLSVTVDCDGAPLLAADAPPGLTRLSARPETLEPAPLAGNVATICTGRRALIFAAGDGRVVFRPADGLDRRRRLDEPIRRVFVDEAAQVVYAAGRFDLLAVLRAPNLDSAVERRSGVGVDLIAAPGAPALYRLALLRGVEALEPATLTPRGVYAMPTCLGGALAYDRERERLFVADWLSAAIVVLETRNLQAVTRLPAPRGVTCLAYDRARDLLLAGVELSSEALVFRPDAAGPPLRLPVGRGVRSLTMAGDRALGVGAAGAFELDLPAIAESFGK
jgi:hypothetical protein